MMRVLVVAACAASALATVPAADASRRHGTRPDTDQRDPNRDRDGDRGHGGRKHDDKKGHGDKGPDFGDKPVGSGSCAKIVRDVKKALAEQSYLPKANGGCMGRNEEWAINAFQRQEGLRPTGKADRRTMKRLAKAEVPKARKGGANDRMLVSLRRQVLYIVEHDKVRRTIAVASGRDGFNTPRGHYKIFRKERNSFSNEFNVNLPWASYFHNGMAFHGGVVEPGPASHGCIRVPPTFAKEVYKKAPMGREVIVF
jgi:lipoprotein-anchoring transpeptidase ErfK/SrfK